MALFPEIEVEYEDEDTEEEEVTTSTELGRTPLYDFNEGKYVITDGKVVECTQEEAIKQWLGFLVKTPVNKYEIYDEEFGTYVHTLIGLKDHAFVTSEIRRELEEKCTENRAVAGIEDFEVNRDGSKLTISFKVITAEDEEVEVEVDV